MDMIQTNPMVKPLKKKEDKGKELSFSKGYFIFKDGRCFSEKSNRFLTKVKNKGKTAGKYYYSYDIKPYGTCLVSRIVMFTYGKHNYEDIREMPKVMHIDGNPENLNISNLKFASQSEINKKYNIKVPEWSYQNRGSIKKESKRIIEKLLEENFTYKKIAEIFETSEMSVYRFVKKHIKNQE